jgi:hypothetical protein
MRRYPEITVTPLRGNGPKYDWSAAATAEIMNLHLHSDAPTAVVFGRILFTILEAMDKADAELTRERLKISRN